MKLKIEKPFWQALSIGVLAGMRTSSAPVIASQILSSHPSKRLNNSALSFMQSTTVATAFKVMALSELIVDKLPSTPNRTKPAGILFRGLSGAVAGACIFKAAGSNTITGAILGGAAAVASTYGSFFLRKSAVSNSSIIDPVIGAIEDALVIGAGVGLTQLA